MTNADNAVNNATAAGIIATVYMILYMPAVRLHNNKGYVSIREIPTLVILEKGEQPTAS